MHEVGSILGLVLRPPIPLKGYGYEKVDYAQQEPQQGT